MNFGPAWAASTWRRLLPPCGPSIRPTTLNGSPQDGSSDVGSRTEVVRQVNDDEPLVVEGAQFVRHSRTVAKTAVTWRPLRDVLRGGPLKR